MKEVRGLVLHYRMEGGSETKRREAVLVLWGAGKRRIGSNIQEFPQDWSLCFCWAYEGHHPAPSVQPDTFSLGTGSTKVYKNGGPKAGGVSTLPRKWKVSPDLY